MVMGSWMSLMTTMITMDIQMTRMLFLLIHGYEKRELNLSPTTHLKQRRRSVLTPPTRVICQVPRTMMFTNSRWTKPELYDCLWTTRSTLRADLDLTS